MTRRVGRLREQPHGGKVYVPSLQVLARIIRVINDDYRAVLSDEVDRFVLRWGWFIARANEKPESPEGRWYARAKEISEEL
jgi:hypothetical protein